MPEKPSLVRLTLFVPGRCASLRAWGRDLRGLSLEDSRLLGVGHRVDVEWVPNDGSFGQAFSFGTVSSKEIAEIDVAPGALVLSCHTDLRRGRAELVSMVERLAEAGALAVRVEESKLGWSVKEWLRLFSAAAARSWHHGAVVFLQDDEAVQSVGMHAFSLPDVWLPRDDDRAALQQFGSSLNVYQLAEDPKLLSGHTFQPDAATKRRCLVRWPSLVYPEDHACNNPYGVWRLGPPDSTASSRPCVAFFVPALRVLLEAAAKKGALSEADVLALRDRAVVMESSPDALTELERTRGYADLDPELVWEQWSALTRARRAWRSP